MPTGFYIASKSRFFGSAIAIAIIGDGGNWIEPFGQIHFPDWIQILDFLHLLVHLFAAARLAHARNPKRAWKLYERMLRDAWGGQDKFTQ